MNRTVGAQICCLPFPGVAQAWTLDIFPINCTRLKGFKGPVPYKLLRLAQRFNVGCGVSYCLRGCLENVVGQASHLPLGSQAPAFSRAMRPFIAGRRPTPLFSDTLEVPKGRVCGNQLQPSLRDLNGFRCREPEVETLG